jgi:hypothetical protein
MLEAKDNLLERTTFLSGLMLHFPPEAATHSATAQFEIARSLFKTICVLLKRTQYIPDKIY